ncbi:MAG: hypothetical protein C4520_18080 [Candidatus Abyssobacteria bacterium SURF_5]|uniref:Abortive infection protein-like C-terminal domain-containing protein n=1 Tax=Abyssobacteria bacterium (strain SURF_5) TaxID=2093360 RepID=A0A3A4NB72_ABYX5|nr:MAG: hypothetical protein C4520_18080 [Candidatus Abyssubacteria bacterium SURF_5]
MHLMSTALDSIAPHFRRVADRWPDAQTLSNHYQAVVASYQGNQHGLVETVKSFVESVCLTILGEYGMPMPSSDASMTMMLVEALRLLGLQNTRGASKLDRILSAHNRLADALSEMRNVNGPIAHGKDGFLDSLTQNHVRTYLLTADTLLSLLLAAFEGTEPDLQFTREPYERFNHLHNRVDSSVTVNSAIEYEDDSPVLVISMKTGGLPDGIELRIEPSRLLYAIDRTAYIEILAASTVQAAASATAGRKAEEMLVVSSPGPIEEEPASEVNRTYTGYLSPLTEELRRYVISLDLSATTPLPSGVSIIESVLGTAEANMGTDWKERESLQARMKVAFRRTLTQFGIPEGKAKEGAEHLVAWFKIQAIGLPNGEGDSAR